ncbi:MAG: hypothetical protein GQ574_07935 [Crocinitomix sp.]|nr:hypothetical protein [Crocinitomix sp.]
MKLKFEPFRLETSTLEHLASFIVKKENGTDLDSNIEPEEDDRLCDWFTCYNISSKESISLTWHDSYYTLELVTTNPKLEAQVINYMLNSSYKCNFLVKQ